jgi:hypothetical protein
MQLFRNPELVDPLLCVRERDRSELVCMLCKMLVVRPTVLNNGDGNVIDVEIYPCGDGPFCAVCIRQHLLMSSACPVCARPTSAAQLVEDTRMERAVRSAIVKCVFYEEGCTWTGENRDFRAHRTSCEFLTSREAQSLDPQSDSSNSSTRFVDFECADCGSSSRCSSRFGAQSHRASEVSLFLHSERAERHSEAGGHKTRVECTEAGDDCFMASVHRSRYCR